MGLFRREDADMSGRPKNPDAYFGFKLLASGYLLYLTWDIIKMYLAGGEDKPSLPLLIFSVVFLAGGALFIAISSFRMWRKYKQEIAEEAQQQALAEDIAADEDAESVPEEETE